MNHSELLNEAICIIEKDYENQEACSVCGLKIGTEYLNNTFGTEEGVETLDQPICDSCYNEIERVYLDLVAEYEIENDGSFNGGDQSIMDVESD